MTEAGNWPTTGPSRCTATECTCSAWALPSVRKPVCSSGEQDLEWGDSDTLLVTGTTVTNVPCRAGTRCCRIGPVVAYDDRRPALVRFAPAAAGETSQLNLSAAHR